MQAHSYGDSSKSRARRAAARKQKRAPASSWSARAGPESLDLNHWPKLVDAGTVVRRSSFRTLSRFHLFSPARARCFITGLSRLAGAGVFQSLLRVSLQHCVGVTAVGLASLFRGAPGLQEANFTGCYMVRSPTAV
jgi:hypothetical protein